MVINAPIQTRIIQSAYVRAEILTEGGILWRPSFKLERGDWVMPLAEAEWSSDANVQADKGLPPYIRKLGGAFLGLPFGGREVPAGISGWNPAPSRPPLHGAAASETWVVEYHGADTIKLGLDLPTDPLFARVEQTIKCHDTEAKLSVQIDLYPLRSGRVSIAYHPILRLPDQTGQMSISTEFAAGHTYPLPIHSHRQAQTAACFNSLANVPACAGGSLDYTKLPYAAPAEDLLLLGRTHGPVAVTYHDQGYLVSLDWDHETLPNCMLWLHDRAQQSFPWQGRFKGLGIEPGAAAFDFATDVSALENPLTELGERTCIQLNGGERLSFHVHLSVEQI